MDLEFSSLKDLYLRVEPALNAKKIELERIGLSHIKKQDVWEYLVETKWKKANGLMLSDIVNDILNTDNNSILSSGTVYFLNNIRSYNYCRIELRKHRSG